MSADHNLKTYMESRRSIPAHMLVEPGPDKTVLEAILKIAARVPDHGKLAPWRFIIYPSSVGEKLGKALGARFKALNPDPSEAMLEKEHTRFLRAPVVVGVVSNAVEHKIPKWEQELSAGAVCMSLLIAANAHGFSANWLSEWYSFDDEAKKILGVEAHEKPAGFIHIGTPKIPPSERPRPDVGAITTWYEG